MVLLPSSYLAVVSLLCQRTSSAKVMEFLVSFRTGCYSTELVDNRVPSPQIIVIRTAQPTSFHQPLGSELFRTKTKCRAILCTRSTTCIRGQPPNDRLPTTRKKRQTTILESKCQTCFFSPEGAGKQQELGLMRLWVFLGYRNVAPFDSFVAYLRWQVSSTIDTIGSIEIFGTRRKKKSEVYLKKLCCWIDSLSIRLRFCRRLSHTVCRHCSIVWHAHRCSFLLTCIGIAAPPIKLRLIFGGGPGVAMRLDFVL